VLGDPHLHAPGTYPGLSSGILQLLRTIARLQADLKEGTIHEDIFHYRWQLPAWLGDQEMAAAWPHQLPHCSLRLFRTHADAAEAHEAAPRWHMHGDYKCTSDSSVSVHVFEQGQQHLQAIAQMQIGLVRLSCEPASRPGLCNALLGHLTTDLAASHLLHCRQGIALVLSVNSASRHPCEYADERSC
jgi:hypothetical protein